LLTAASATSDGGGRLSKSSINTDPEDSMSHAIIGFGAVGQALARAFARQEIEVAIAARRPPEELVPLAKTIGPTVRPMTLQDAIKAEIILLAVPFWAHEEVAKTAANWHGKIVIDVTNSFGVSPEELGSLPSSVVVSKAFTGAKLVKAFNHLPAGVLAADPNVNGGRRVIFLSSDDESATVRVGALVEQLGFAPVGLGKLAEGAPLVQARGREWAPLIFQDLIKFT
jgi:8-hydroxy-5-deazaflavin:NADPH oxidoreductase